MDAGRQIMQQTPGERGADGKTHRKLYDIFRSRDARFDGRFYVGVTSTGIYCRTVCSARVPKEENCRFFRSAAEAEAAGFRPCLTCRPEQAPGSAPVDVASQLAVSAAQLIEGSCSGESRLPQIARQLGCSERHLRRVFQEAFHVTPVQYQQTCRLLLAKNLLMDTGLSVLDIAMAAGFGSLRQFNHAFRQHYQMAPTDMRKKASVQRRSGKLSLLLGYRQPFRFEEILRFLADRAIPGVEKVEDGVYYRTVRIPRTEPSKGWSDQGAAGCGASPGSTVHGRGSMAAGKAKTAAAEAGSVANAQAGLAASRKQDAATGWISVRDVPEKSALQVTVSDGLLPVLPQVLGRVRQLFDLYCEPDIIADALGSMNEIEDGLFVPGVRVPGSFDAFEMVLRAIIGQQITVKGARTILGRIAAVFGNTVETEVAGLDRIFPSAKAFADLPGEAAEHLGPLGVTRSRATAIHTIAKMLAAGQLQLSQWADPEEEMEKLLAIKGIGPWTAQYIAMRTMGFTDAFLETDYGVKEALADYTPAQRRSMAKSWQPWGSYATVSLWNRFES